MRRLIRFYVLALVISLGVLGLGVHYAVADTSVQHYDASYIRSHSSTCTITTTDANFATLQPFLTIEPQDATALDDVKVYLDLDYATTGFADLHSTETIQFCVGRKVDGTNWRIDAEEVTTAISGTNADALGSRSVTIPVGAVLPSQDVRIYVVMSAEGNSNFTIPYLCTYRAQALPTFTDID